MKMKVMATLMMVRPRVMNEVATNMVMREMTAAMVLVMKEMTTSMAMINHNW